MTARSLDLLRRANTKLVTLERATEAAERGGLINPGDRLVARVRKVTAKEIAHTVGRVPRLFAAIRERGDDESPREFSERMARKALEEQELYDAMTEQSYENNRGLCVCGVTGIGIVSVDGVEEIEDVRLSMTDAESRPEALLGADFDAVADAVMLWSSDTARPDGGAENIEAFPAERPDGDAGADSPRVGLDAEPVP